MSEIISGPKKQIEELALLLGIETSIFPEAGTGLLNDEDILLLLTMIRYGRYCLPRSNVPKSLHWLELVLGSLAYDEKRFIGQFRMNRQSFMELCATLSGASVFNSTQDPLQLQVAVALYSFGTYGNSSSAPHIATKFGVSEGSVVNFTRRVIEALKRISKSWIFWPSAQERKNISSEMASKLLPGCIGYVDGTDVPFEYAPLENKDAYWSRKKKYSMQLQIVCDPCRRIRDVFTGYPGSVHDANVFSSSPVGVVPCKFFGDGEFLIGDSAYTLTETMIVPYKRSVNGLTAPQRSFNNHLSSKRVAVEHTIGLLKGRFQSLKCLRVRVCQTIGHLRACEWILACTVLHNMLIQTDPWVEMDDFDMEEAAQEEADVDQNAQQLKGAFKRNALLQLYEVMKNI